MSNQDWLVFKKKNFKLLLISLGLILLGFIVMAVGENNYDNAFGFRRITLAPLIMLVGYVLVIVSIMKTGDSKE